MRRILLLIILFFCLPFLSGGYLTAHAAVVINEMFPKPDGDGTNEWIELYNTGGDTVSLNQWKLENTAGEKKEYTMNASFNIAPNGYLIFTRAYTGIALSDNGDTVNLYDIQGTKVDSQSYVSTVGINRAVGRVTDGTGVWSENCTVSTQGLPNNCIAPTSTPTPLPTSVPLPPAASGDPAAPPPDPIAPSPLSGITTISPNVLGVMRTPTPTPLPPDLVKIDVPKSIILSKTTIVQILVILLCWILLSVVAYLNNKRMRRKKKLHAPPPISPPVV